MTRDMSRRALILLEVLVLVLATGTTVTVAGFSEGPSPSAPEFRSTCEPSSVARTVVQVGLFDAGGAMMDGTGMMMRIAVSPNTIREGKVTFIVTNYGQLNHELLVFPAPADGIGARPVAADGRINEAQRLGEASRTCGEGAENGITPGGRVGSHSHSAEGTMSCSATFPGTTPMECSLDSGCSKILG
jgi:hypothetical protein